MALTNFKISMSEYKRLVEKDAKMAGDGTVYGIFLSNLFNLTNLTEKYFTRDENGNLPILKAEDYKSLIDSYIKLGESCNKFLGEDHPKNKLENKRVHMIKQLSKYIGKDLRGLINADKEKSYTLSDVVEKARMKTVDLTNAKLSHVGGNISSRIPLKTASGIKGFFTKKSVFNFKDEQIQIFNKFSNVLPGPYSEQLREFADDTELAEDLMDKLSFLEKINLDGPVTDKIYNNVANILMSISDEDVSVIKEKLMEEPEFLKKSVEMLNELRVISISNIAHERAGIPDGSRNDQRNSAMTDIAAYMGMGHILAKAVPMQIVQGNQVIEGTFMENANGEDAARLTPESKMMQADKESFNTPSLLKQIADMQILDYICGNTDRHIGNMLYTLETGKDGKMMVSGIVGIDNDNSFGTLLFDKEADSTQLTSLNNIGVISQSCYQTVSNMSPDALKVILGDKLSAEEMNAAAQRLTLLQKELETERIIIVEEEQWGKGEFSLEELEKAGKAFKNVNRIAKNIAREKEFIQSEAKRDTEINFSSGKDITDQAEARFNEIYGKLEEFASKAGKLKSKFHKNSEEYKKMITSLKEALESGKDIKDKLGQKQNVEMNSFKDFAKLVVDLGISSQNYISAKNLSQRTDLGKDRYSLATDMRNLAQENFAIKEMPVKKDVEPKELKQPEEEMQL